MKNWFTVVRGYNQGVFKTEAEAKRETQGYYDSKYKGFDTFEEAEAYLEHYRKEEVPYVYVVKSGWNPGIYERAEAGLQILGFENPCVRKYKKSNLNLAQSFLESPIIDRPKKEKVKRTKEEKLQDLRNVSLKFRSRYICFMDSEANQSKVISVGATMFDTETGKVVNNFYKTCKYKSFVKMDPHCARISNFTTEEVAAAEDFLLTYDSFMSWLQSFDCSEVCTWSGTDKNFFNKTLAEYNKQLPKELRFVDIQRRISADTVDLVANECWGLADMKYFLGLERNVKHHALMDAKDLCDVYVAWKNNSLIPERVLELAR